MGIALDGGFPVSTNKTNQASVASIDSGSITTAADRLVVAGIAWAGATGAAVAPLSIAGGGLSWTKLVEKSYFAGGSGSCSVAVFYAYTATGITAQTLTVTRSGSDAGAVDVLLDIYSLSGAKSDQTGALNGGAASNSSTPLNASFSPAAGSWALWALVDGGASGGSSTTLQANNTKDDQILDAVHGNTCNCGRYTGQVPGGSITTGCTGSDTFSGFAVTEILAAPIPVSPPPPIRPPRTFGGPDPVRNFRSVSASSVDAIPGPDPVGSFFRPSAPIARGPGPTPVGRFRSAKAYKRALPPPSAIFPVAQHSNKRYLVDALGNPFPIKGRAVHGFSWRYGSTVVDDLLTDCVNKGFNAIECSTIHHFPANTHHENPGKDAFGYVPWLKNLAGGTYVVDTSYTSGTAAPDLETPNENYWASVDEMLAKAANQGILVFFFPLYWGFGTADQGWSHESKANNTTSAGNPAWTKNKWYGDWLGRRYRDQKNIIWMFFGDHSGGGTDTTCMQDIHDGVVNAGPASTLWSGEFNGDTLGSDTAFASQLSLNPNYDFSGIHTVSNARGGWTYVGPIPAYETDGPFDQEGPDGSNFNIAATQPVRRFQYWAWLNSIAGIFPGNECINRMNSTAGSYDGKAWDDVSHRDSQHTMDMSRMFGLIDSVQWWRLQPSGLSSTKTLITAGGGTADTSNYVAAAATLSGDLLIAYLPPGHSGTITVDMTAMTGPARARWWDPTSGLYTDISTGLPAQGTQVFTQPGANSQGTYTDWLLVMDATTDPFQRTFYSPNMVRGPNPVSRFRSRGAYAPSTSGPFQYSIDVGGTLAPSGGLTKQTGKQLAGGLTSIGDISKQTQKPLAGTLTSAGALVKQTQKTLAGTLTSAGALTRLTAKTLAGALTSAGAISKRTAKAFSGTLTSAGTVARQVIVATVSKAIIFLFDD